MRSALLEQNSGKYFQERPTIMSAPFGVTGTTAAGVLGYVPVPAGAYVTKVALMSTIAVGTQSLDVGDGDDADRYLDGITAMTQYNIIAAPNVASTAITAECNGRYYAAADTIDCTSTTTASADVSVGSCRLLVWYFV
jgi:hypothetical protein